MMWSSLETTPKTITVAGNFVFITLGTLKNPDLPFEGAGNGPVLITRFGREHELYSGASPILLVEHCVTFRHDRRLLSLLGFVHNWPTRRWSATKKGKPVFIKRKWNHVVFSRATILSFHPVYIRIYIYIYIYICVCVCVCVCVIGVSSQENGRNVW